MVAKAGVTKMATSMHLPLAYGSFHVKWYSGLAGTTPDLAHSVAVHPQC